MTDSHTCDAAPQRPVDRALFRTCEPSPTSAAASSSLVRRLVSAIPWAHNVTQRPPPDPTSSSMKSSTHRAQLLPARLVPRPLPDPLAHLLARPRPDQGAGRARHHQSPSRQRRARQGRPGDGEGERAKHREGKGQAGGREEERVKSHTNSRLLSLSRAPILSPTNEPGRMVTGKEGTDRDTPA